MSHDTMCSLNQVATYLSYFSITIYLLDRGKARELTIYSTYIYIYIYIFLKWNNTTDVFHTSRLSDIYWCFRNSTSRKYMAVSIYLLSLSTLTKVIYSSYDQDFELDHILGRIYLLVFPLMSTSCSA